MPTPDPGDVYIKYAADDDGNTRPVPQGTVFWASPSLWLTTGGGTAHVNQKDTINVRVDNHSDNNHMDVQVQVWVADPTVGFQPQQGRVPGSPNPFNPRQQPIPYKSKLTVPPRGFGVASIEWTPEQAHPHRCIGANCFVTGGSTPEGVEFVAAGGATPFDAAKYQHMGQRNIAIADAQQNGGKMQFAFRVANVGATPQRYTLAVREILGEDGLDTLVREQVLQRSFATVAGLDLDDLVRMRIDADCENPGQPLERVLLDNGGVPILVDSENTYELRPPKRRAEKVELSSFNLLPRGGEGSRYGDQEAEVEVRPGTLVPVALDVTLAEDTGAGGLHTFQISQYDEEGALVGGLRVHALAVTDEILDPCGCPQ
ncbi:hypothetical protein [Nocardia thraciensis]